MFSITKVLTDVTREIPEDNMYLIGKVGNFTPLYKSFNFQATEEKVEKALSSTAAVRRNMPLLCRYIIEINVKTLEY